MCSERAGCFSAYKQTDNPDLDKSEYRCFHRVALNFSPYSVPTDRYLKAGLKVFLVGLGHKARGLDSLPYVFILPPDG